MISTLDVVWTAREGGLGRTKRRFLDFVIDGVPLSSRFNVDFITPFGWLDTDEQQACIDRLLGKSAPDMPNGRTALYICPECGDLGCGAVTVLVQRNYDVIIWKHFGFENDYEDVVHTEGFQNIGPYTFDANEYNNLFEHVRLMIND